MAAPSTYYAIQNKDAEFEDVSVSGTLAITGATTFTGAITAGTIGATAVTGTTVTASTDLILPITVASADGAVAARSGVVYITKAGVAALTLANPTSGTDNGKVLTVVATTAHAHTLSNAAGAGFNGGGASVDVATFGGAAGDNITLTAYNGVWYILNSVNITLG